MKNFSCLFLVMFVLASAAVAEEQSKVFDSFAEEMLETLDSNVKVAIQPFNSKKVDLPKKITTGFNNRLVDSLLKKSNFKISIIERGKLEDIWKEAEEFGNADFEKLVKEADAEILIIGDLRLRKGGVEISYRGYDLRQGKRGKIIASTRTQNLDFDLAAETSIPVSDELGEVFLQIMKSGGIIANAKKPEEFYANARMYEQKGDSGNARRSYAKFFTFHLDYIDPHLRYQKYLKVQEGREGAREVYFEMKEDSKSFVTEYASILLFSRKTRVKKLEKFMEKHPEFGPGYFELSKEFSEARLGEQTQKDKGNEKKYLKKFYELHEQGKVLKYFMDKDMVSKFLNNAEKRMTALKLFDESILENPVTLSAMCDDQMGCMVNAHLIDAPREVFYKCVGDSEFRSAGFFDHIDPTTGKPMPSSNFTCPLDMMPGEKIYISYKDMQGEMQGPYGIEWSKPGQGVIKDERAAFEQSRSSALRIAPPATYRFHMDRHLLYFTNIDSTPCEVRKVMYAWDDDKNLDKEYHPMNECDPDAPMGIKQGGHMGKILGRSTGYLEFPSGANFIAVQITFPDGTKGKVWKIEKNAKAKKDALRIQKKYSRTERIAMLRAKGLSNCEIKKKLDHQACRIKEIEKGKEGDLSECDDSGRLSLGTQMGLSAIPYVGGLLALGSMVAQETAQDNLSSDDCDLEKPVETKDTKFSTGDSDESDLWEDEYE